MSEGKYSETQLNKLFRREAGIWAFKVLELVPEGIVIQLPKAFGENKTAEIPLSPKTKTLYKVGDYADLTLFYTVTDGAASSFRAKYWGQTPPQFFPANWEKISKV